MRSGENRGSTKELQANLSLINLELFADFSGGSASSCSCGDCRTRSLRSANKKITFFRIFN